MTTIYDNETVRYRLKYVLQVIDRDRTIAAAARDAGVCWSTMNSWKGRYEDEGVAGLLNKPRGLFQPVDASFRKQIIDLKVENRTRSGRKIRDIFNKESPQHFHRQTIWRILKAAGENKRIKDNPKVFRDFERCHPNSLWQIDYMDAIVIKGIGLVFLILILDDYTRKIIGGIFIPDRTAYQALKLLWNSVEDYGIPDQMYSDRGRQFRSHLGKEFTHYELVCKRLGIGVIHGTARHPQGRGKIERLFGFIQDDFLPEYRFKDINDMNQKFQEWISWYNGKHEHSSLGGNPPNSRYVSFTPRMPYGDLFDIFSEHHERKVRKNATISFRKKIYPVDPRFIKDKVIVKAFGDIIKIYGHSTFLGEYDARINYHERMLRRIYTRIVKKDGTIKFRNIRYLVGKELIGNRVEILVIRDQLRAFLDSNKLLIFKLGESDAVIVKMDR